jgi:ABC-type transport system involved in cytochrome c biogenesis permease subunit
MINTPGLLWLLLYLLPFAYFVALVDYMVAFFTDSPRAKRLAYPLLVVSVVLNVVYFAVFTAYFEHIPMVSVHQVFGAVGLAVAATYTFVERRSGNPHTGAFVLFMVLICQVVNATYPRLDHYVPELLQSVLFSFHVSAAVLGYSAFALAAIYALMYLLLYDSMRTKTFGLFFQRLPALVVLDRMNFYAAAIGFAFLTLAIILGFVWSAFAFDKMRIDPKIGVALLTWLLYLFSILGRQYRSWRGPRLAISSLVGFVVVLFSMFAVNFFFTKFHVFV